MIYFISLNIINCILYVCNKNSLLTLITLILLIIWPHVPGKIQPGAIRMLRVGFEKASHLTHSNFAHLILFIS